jgi:hypothetical protein
MRMLADVGIFRAKIPWLDLIEGLSSKKNHVPNELWLK